MHKNEPGTTPIGFVSSNKNLAQVTVSLRSGTPTTLRTRILKEDGHIRFKPTHMGWVCR